MAIQSRQRAPGAVQMAPQTRKLPALEQGALRPRGGRVWGRFAARREVWLDALFVWGITRVLLLAVTFLVPALNGAGSALKNPLRIMSAWYTQDAAQFIYIAQHGYDQTWRTAFFPLFPLLEHLLAPIVGGDYGLAGLVVANGAFFGALVILRDLVERDFGAETAHRTILYLAIFPTAFYFFAPYSESLYLCVTAGAFSALRQRRWWLAGVLGGIGALARSPAILLLVPFAVEFIIARRYRMVRWWESLAAVLIPAGTGVYALYCQIRFHDPLVFSQAQAYWTRSLQVPGAAIVAGAHALLAGGQPGVTLTHLALNLAAIVAFLVLGAIVLWRLPRSYGLYTAALLVYYLLFAPTYGAIALQGQGRFVAVLFPVFILLGQWGARQRLHETLVLAQMLLLTVLVIHFFAAASWGTLPLWW